MPVPEAPAFCMLHHSACVFWIFIDWTVTGQEEQHCLLRRMYAHTKLQSTLPHLQGQRIEYRARCGRVRSRGRRLPASLTAHQLT